MSKTYTMKNLAATLENLNMRGIFVKDNTTLDTAIPMASIGLYQLINELISELSTIRSAIKTQEKKIQAVLAGDNYDDAYKYMLSLKKTIT